MNNKNQETMTIDITPNNDMKIAMNVADKLFQGNTSIDLNGMEDSLRVDLRNPIMDEAPELIDKFDVIIDIGTSEHVEYQYMNFKNLYDMLKVGGIFIHVLPKGGYWEGHCKYKYNFDFFKLLAESNDYEILDLHNRIDKDICCSMKKVKSNKFMNESDFDKLPMVIESGNNFSDRQLYGYAYGKK